MQTVVLNGKELTRADVRGYLADKRVSLWSDWCITHPDRMELAIDWFLGEMNGLATSVS